MDKKLIVSFIFSLLIHFFFIQINFKYIVIKKNAFLINETLNIYVENNNVDMQKDAANKIEYNSKIYKSNSAVKSKITTISNKEFNPYLLSDSLDVQPKPLNEIIIEVPQGESITEGFVILEVYINAQGFVEQIKVDKSSVPLEYDTLAINSFKQAYFSPGILNNQPVPTKVKIRVEFSNNL